MKRTTLPIWLGLAVACALATPAWSQESVPTTAGSAAAPSETPAPERKAPAGQLPGAGPAPAASPVPAWPLQLPAQQGDYADSHPDHRKTVYSKRRDAGVTTLVAGGINSAIGLGLLAGSIAMLSQNTHCDLGSSYSAKNSGCGNAIFGPVFLGFGASHLLVGSILLIVGGTVYARAKKVEM